MQIREQVPLAALTTFRVGGPARAVADTETIADVREALSYAKAEGLPYFVIGEGSNLLPLDQGYNGVLIRMRVPGLAVEAVSGGAYIIAGAGVSWETVVREAAANGLWGIENMAGIPGTIGAAPVQNIGAYGMELSHTLAYVEALDAGTGEIVRLDRNACDFGYRESRFKRERHLIILRVALALTREGAPQLAYSDLARLKEEGIPLATPAEIGEAVRSVRARKFPDLSVSGTAGSFFKNPILTTEAYEGLVERYGEVPSYPAPGGVKIPLAFVLDRMLGLKGYQRGRAGLFGNQPLVLVAESGASAREIEELAREIESRVHDAIDIVIEREVRSVE